jgi:hypothetical protein
MFNFGQTQQAAAAVAGAAVTAATQSRLGFSIPRRALAAAKDGLTATLDNALPLGVFLLTFVRALRLESVFMNM